MRDYAKELVDRVEFIRGILRDAHADGIVFGNSGGKDSALVGILCRRATPNVLGGIMPCQSKRNYGEDTDDANDLSQQFEIENITVDLSETKAQIVAAIEKAHPIQENASANIAPRLRMTTLYTIGQTKNYLVAGTGNRSERTMGYFTKWGDGAFDFNPIGDLTATEVFEFLRFLGAPENIVTKAPSAGLYEGQTDEKEMGITYADLDRYILTGEGSDEVKAKVDGVYARTAHKRRLAPVYGEE